MLPSKQAKVILTFLLLLFALSTITFPESSSGNLSGETALVTQPHSLLNPAAPNSKGKSPGNEVFSCPIRPEQPQLPRQHQPTCVPHVDEPSGPGLVSSVTSGRTALEAFKAMVIFDYEGRTTTGLLIEINSAQCLIGIFENLYNKNIANLYWSIIP